MRHKVAQADAFGGAAQIRTLNKAVLADILVRRLILQRDHLRAAMFEVLHPCVTTLRRGHEAIATPHFDSTHRLLHEQGTGQIVDEGNPAFRAGVDSGNVALDASGAEDVAAPTLERLGQQTQADGASEVPCI
jgi:hypothetical protein